MVGPAFRDCELKVIKDQFKDLVFTTQTGNTPLECPKYRFSANSLIAAMKEAADCTDATMLMLVHYGLVNGKLSYGVAFPCAAIDDRKFSLTGLDYYVPNASGKLEKYTGNWQSDFGGKYQDVYLERGSGRTAYDPNTDTRYVTHSLDRVLSFIRDNQDPNATNQADSVQIESFSHLRDSVHLHHGSALVAYDGNVRMMDDATTHSRYFYNKALDYGTPCPQMCDLFEMEHKGEEVLGTSCP